MKRLTSSKKVRVATIQYQAIPFDKPENLDKLEQLITQAAQVGAQLVVLPEMCTTGLLIGNKNNASSLAEMVPGPTTARFAELAARLNLMIVFGLITRQGDTPCYHNSQVLLSSTGQILACYDKRHLFGPDWHWAEPGRGGFKAVRTNLGIIGLGICYDFNFADLWTFLLSHKVDIFTFSTNWVEDCSPLSFWEAAVRGSNISLIAANNWSNDKSIHFSGESAVISPTHGILAQCGSKGNAVVIADSMNSTSDSCRRPASNRPTPENNRRNTYHFIGIEQHLQPLNKEQLSKSWYFDENHQT